MFSSNEVRHCIKCKTTNYCCKECQTRIHSSRMRTAYFSVHFSRVSARGGFPPEGVCLGVSVLGCMSGGLGCLPLGVPAQGRGVCLGGVCLGGGCIPPVNRITDKCKNITFLQLRLQVVTKRLELQNIIYSSKVNPSGDPDFLNDGEVYEKMCIHEVAADPGFPGGDGCQPKREAPTYYLAKFRRNCTKMKKIGPKGRGASKMLLCRSATV